MKKTLAAMATLLLSACQTVPLPPLAQAGNVDLERFMGRWYVIANIPTFIEKGAHNAIESYRLEPDGTIATTFTFRAGGFDGEQKRYEPRGFVVDRATNAVWGMQFIWPIKSDFRIAYLSPDYSVTVIARNRRDYVWLMARTPSIPEAEYERLRRFIGEQGYDLSKLERVPQRWDSPAAGS